jgi:hypothetical protein
VSRRRSLAAVAAWIVPGGGGGPRGGDDRRPQLRKAVLGWARQLGPADRTAFLERLGAKLEVPGDRSERLMDSPVEDRDALAADWETALAPLARRRDVEGEWAHRLYVDVVAAIRGPEGVGELARAGGPRAGQLFIAWSDLAVGCGDLTEAEAAAREGVATLKPGWERAALADRLAVLADHPEFLLGRAADRLDRLQGLGGLLGPLDREAPAHPGLDRDHRQGVSDDVVEFLGDPHPFLSNLAASAIGAASSW